MSPVAKVARLLCLVLMSASALNAADPKDVAATVERFARVGSASAPDFSPDSSLLTPACGIERLRNIHG